MLTYDYVDFAVDRAMELLAIDSPTGYTPMAVDYAEKQFSEMGYAVKRTNKGGLLVDLGGEDSQDGLLLQVHVDTIGAMVAEVKANGRLRVVPLGGLKPFNTEGENVRVYTKENGVYEGTFQLCNPSIHVNQSYSDVLRTFDNTEVVLDEFVSSAQETRDLGVSAGDFVCYEPRPRVTGSGFIKGRFLDDKLSVGIVMSFAKYLKDQGITPKRHVYVHVTIYEEVGYGGNASVPEGVTESIAIDMGCVGDGLQCKEHQVSICAKDTACPYSYEVVCKLLKAAKREGADYAVDVYPRYGSDVETTLRGGYDIRHGLIGPGVYASHGYERSHKDGVYNTIKVLKGYLEV